MFVKRQYISTRGPYAPWKAEATVSVAPSVIALPKAIAAEERDLLVSGLVLLILGLIIELLIIT
jgi:hypothetical protein